MDVATAKTLAEGYLDRELRPEFGPGKDCELVIIDEFTEQRKWGWIFFWNSRAFAETRDIRKSMVGNGPIAVLASDGSVHQLGAGGGLKFQVLKFEEKIAGRSKS